MIIEDQNHKFMQRFFTHLSLSTRRRGMHIALMKTTHLCFWLIQITRTLPMYRFDYNSNIRGQSNVYLEK